MKSHYDHKLFVFLKSSRELNIFLYINFPTIKSLPQNNDSFIIDQQSFKQLKCILVNSFLLADSNLQLGCSKFLSLSCSTELYSSGLAKHLFFFFSSDDKGSFNFLSQL